MPNKMTYTDLKANILRRFILGETYGSICKDFDLQTPKTRDLAHIFTRELWQYIKHYKIAHPYTPDRYEHAYSGHGRSLSFLEYYLTPADMRAEKDFWTALIDRVVSERGGVDRKLETSDPMERLELAPRSVNLLRGQGVETIGDLLTLIDNKEHWTHIHGLGESTRNTILEKLSVHGFEVMEEVLLPTSIELMREALMFVKNPAILNPKQRDELAERLEKRINRG